MDAVDDWTVRKKGPSCPGKYVDGTIWYVPQGTFSISKMTKPDLMESTATNSDTFKIRFI